MFGIVIAIFTWGFIQQIFFGIVWGSKGKSMSDAALIIVYVLVSVLCIGLILLFKAMSLKTVIRKDGIYYKFFPFHLSFKKIALEKIDSYEVKTYHPIKEYGGWGISFSKKGKVYNVSGNQGLEIKRKKGKSILFGTLKPEELEAAMKQLSL